MRLTGMDRYFRQREANRKHRHQMDEYVEECKGGNYSNLCMLVSANSISAILRRNGASLADFERWQQEAQAAKTPVREKPDSE